MAIADRSARPPAAVAMVVCAVQCILVVGFATNGSARWIGASISAALAGIAFVELRRRPNRRIWRIGAILVVAFATLIVFGTGEHAKPWPKPWPMLVLGWYLTGLLAIGIAFVVRQSAKPVVAMFILATGAGWAAGLMVPSQLRQPPVRYFAGGAFPDELLTYRLGPRCIYRNYYPNNPRGYFVEELYEEPWQRLWEVKSTGKAYAELRMPVKRAGPLRVDVQLPDAEHPWNAQLVHAPIPRPVDGVVRVSLRLRADRDWECSLAVSDSRDRTRSLCPAHKLDVGTEWKEFEIAETAADAEEMIVTLALGAQFGHFELGECLFTGSNGDLLTTVPHDVTRYSVEYRTNSLGFRAKEIEQERPKDCFRVVAVGDSFTFGQGVHIEDTFCNQLESLLDQLQPNEGFRDYEVFNLGRCGYTVREERLVFEQYVDLIDPQLLLLVMCVNDARPDSARAVDSELRPHPPIPDLEECLQEIDALEAACRSRDIRFAVVLFRVTPELGFSGTFMERLADHSKQHGLVYLELGDILLGKFAGSQLMVHETDGHPNELAHRVAAESILKLLLDNELLR